MVSKIETSQEKRFQLITWWWKFANMLFTKNPFTFISDVTFSLEESHKKKKMVSFATSEEEKCHLFINNQLTIPTVSGLEGDQL